MNKLEGLVNETQVCFDKNECLITFSYCREKLCSDLRVCHSSQPEPPHTLTIHNAVSSKSQPPELLAEFTIRRVIRFYQVEIDAEKFDFRYRQVLVFTQVILVSIIA